MMSKQVKFEGQSYMDWLNELVESNSKSLETLAEECYQLWLEAIHLEHLAIRRGNKFKELLEKTLPYLNQLGIYVLVSPELISEIEKALNTSIQEGLNE